MAARVEFDGEHESIICGTCRSRSYNPHDVAHWYCAHCHVFHEECSDGRVLPRHLDSVVLDRDYAAKWDWWESCVYGAEDLISYWSAWYYALSEISARLQWEGGVRYTHEQWRLRYGVVDFLERLHLQETLRRYV